MSTNWWVLILAVGITLGMILIGVLHPREIRSDLGFWILMSTPILGAMFALFGFREKW